MAGSTFGTIFKVTTWGESHGPAIGAVVDGCPAGLPLDESSLKPYMERRRPNGGKLSTKRVEPDNVEILSGVYEGLTTGAPISLLIRSTDQHSSDYDALKEVCRPGHADFGFDAKFGIRDHRGGGRSSARETAARVAAGGIALIALGRLGVRFRTEVTAIGGVPFSRTEEIDALLDSLKAAGDSIGSEVECTVSGFPAGIGDPVFDKLDALLGQALFSIGAVKAVEIGDGRKVSLMRGSENNDPFHAECGRIKTTSNHAGGILGGISNGSDIRIHVYFKPTPSISLPQDTVTRSGENIRLGIRGRHDPVIAPRAAVVVEAMTGLVLFDGLLRNMTSRMSLVEKFYRLQ